MIVQMIWADNDGRGVSSDMQSTCTFVYVRFYVLCKGELCMSFTWIVLLLPIESRY